MADEKKSFIGYCDWLQLVEDLEDAEAGKIFLWLLKYVNSTSENNPPYPGEKHLKIICKVFQKQLYEDFIKWKDERERRSEAGRKGGLAKSSNTKQCQAEPSRAKQYLANEADNVNDNVNVNVNDNVIYGNKLPVYNNVREEEENISNLQNLLEQIETLFGRCLTIYETTTIQDLTKSFTASQIISEIKAYKDKENPIAYIKKKIENSKIQERVYKEEEQPKAKTYEFNDWASAFKVAYDEEAPQNIRDKAKEFMEGKR